MAKEAKEKDNNYADESPARIAYRKLIEAYKVSNPKKYELKKAELEKKLAAIE